MATSEDHPWPPARTSRWPLTAWSASGGGWWFGGEPAVMLSGGEPLSGGGLVLGHHDHHGRVARVGVPEARPDIRLRPGPGLEVRAGECRCTRDRRLRKPRTDRPLRRQGGLRARQSEFGRAVSPGPTVAASVVAAYPVVARRTATRPSISHHSGDLIAADGAIARDWRGVVGPDGDKIGPPSLPRHHRTPTVAGAARTAAPVCSQSVGVQVGLDPEGHFLNPPGLL